MIRILSDSDKQDYTKFAVHPLQSWKWGEFRRGTGIKVIRIGLYDNNKLTSALQLTIHKLPFLPFSVGYFPKGALPDTQLLEALTQVGRENKCIFIKLEPNVTTEDIKIKKYSSSQYFNSLISQYPALHFSPKPLFTKFTFYIDLNQSEEELLKKMTGKTRYNIRVAQKHGVTIQEENTDEAFAAYLKLTQETTKRQGFYAHNEMYHRAMWQILNQQPTTNNLTPIARLLTARYQNKILVTWIVFLFKDILYYPYGASSSEFKQTMASNLIMWEAIRWGKNHGANIFDLWGTPGSEPTPTDPYYGFHKFKLGYGPKLVEFVGTYDLVIYPVYYWLFNLANRVRWGILRLISH